MSVDRSYPQVRSFRSLADLQSRLSALETTIPLDAAVESGPSGPLGQAIEVAGRLVGNRFAILPMEGWDATVDGRPTELVERRWGRFGSSGAKLIWGGEAVAVTHAGRANPRQLRMGEDTADDLGALRRGLIGAHERAFDRTDDLLVGLQLTHSGRFARPDPDGLPSPRLAYRHPILDQRQDGITDDAVLRDEEVDELVAQFVDAAVLASDAGYDFVDVKACHGYLLHEFLSARTRHGRYGGDLAGRSRLLLSIIGQVRERVPDLAIGVRLSVFDEVPFRRGPDGVGVAETAPAGSGTPAPFGGDGSTDGDAEMPALLDALVAAGVSMVCITGGSPYYVPHVQRPAFFPPSDGYRPPEDPLVGVARLLDAARRCKQAQPGLAVIASGVSYLQQWSPHAAQAVVRLGHADFVGYGRMALSYPDLPSDVLAGRPVDRRRICQTFSDCTTAPRNGMVSGCYPLDEFYKTRPERARILEIKRATRAAPTAPTEAGDGKMTPDGDESG